MEEEKIKNKKKVGKKPTKEIEEKPKIEEETVENPKPAPDITKTSETEKKEVKSQEKKKVEKIKKFEATVSAYDIPISTKHSMAICKFIKGKNINNALKDLEQVLKLKKPIPMKGEIPHRKGKGISSGRYPIKSVKNFIVLLKSLSANSTQNDINEPIISLAIANIASQPYGKAGRVRKKRTHILIKVIEKNKLLNKK
jgi:large subunit ribosomal protein L22